MKILKPKPISPDKAHSFPLMVRGQEKMMAILEKNIREGYNLHAHWEFGVVLQGAYTDIRSKSTCVLNPGEFWWCGPWELHGWEVKDPKTEVMVVEFFPAVLYTIPSSEPFFSAVFLPFLQPKIRRTLESASTVEKKNGPVGTKHG
jgi:hypothetical protein